MSTTISEVDVTQHNSNEGHQSWNGLHSVTSTNGRASVTNDGSDSSIRRIPPMEHEDIAPSILVPFSLETGNAEAPLRELSKGQTILLITTLTGITFANSISMGLITIGIPHIAIDLGLSDNLLLWYVVCE